MEAYNKIKLDLNQEEEAALVDEIAALMPLYELSENAARAMSALEGSLNSSLHGYHAVVTLRHRLAHAAVLMDLLMCKIGEPVEEEAVILQRYHEAVKECHSTPVED